MTNTAVVILNWNGQELLKKFLPKVIAHSKLDGVKIYVADNASTDNSIAFIKKQHPEVGIIQLDQNYGFAGGYNKALCQIEADYFLLLNSDVEPKANWLPPLINAVEKNPNLAACMPKILAYDEPNKFEYAGAAGGYIDYLGYPFCRGRILNENEVDNGQYNNPLPVFWASGAALFIQSKIFKEVGGLDEYFFAHMEEIDLCWRIKNMGYDIECIPQSEVLHVGGATLSQQHPQKTYLNFRNNLLMLVKNLPSKKVKRTMLLRMIMDGIAFFFFILKGEFHHAAAVIKAHLSFYKLLPLFLKKRFKLKPTHKKINHDEIYPQSIIMAFYLKGVNHFSTLKHFSLKIRQ